MEQADIAMDPTGGTRQPADSGKVRAGRAALAAAAFFSGAFALVNPAFAGECSNMAEMFRAAARDNELSEERLLVVETAIEKALQRQEHGDEQGCLSELTVAREALQE